VLVVSFLVAALVGFSPKLGIIAAVVVFVVCLAIDLKIRLGISPMWPLLGIATLQPWNGIRPLSSVTVGDVGLLAMGIAVIPFIRRAQLRGRLVAPLLGLCLVIAGGLVGGSVLSHSTNPSLLSGVHTLAQLNSTGQLAGVGGETSSLLKFVLGAPCVVLIFIFLDPPAAFAERMGKAYGVGAALSALAAIGGYQAGKYGYYERAVGLAAHFLHFGLTCLFGLAVGIGWLVSTRRRWARIVAAAIIVLCLYGVVLSGARSALIGAAVVILYLALLGRGTGIGWLVGIGVPAAIGLVIAAPLLPAGSAVNRLLGTGSKSFLVSGSNAQHLDALSTALNQIGSHPWTGVGFAAGLSAHNLELEAADIGGVLAVIGLVVVWFVILRIAWRQLRFGVPRELWGRACLPAGMLGYFCLAQFENIFWDRHLWFFACVSLLAAPSMSELQSNSLRRSKGSQRSGRESTMGSPGGGELPVRSGARRYAPAS
jgi:hypothetical protein